MLRNAAKCGVYSGIGGMLVKHVPWVRESTKFTHCYNILRENTLEAVPVKTRAEKQVKGRNSEQMNHTCEFRQTPRGAVNSSTGLLSNNTGISETRS